MATATMPLHRREFPKDMWLPRRLLEAFAACGWEDNSWHNDACPIFEREDGTVVFCDARDRKRRELASPRYGRYQIVGPGAIDVANFWTTDGLICWLLENR